MKVDEATLERLLKLLARREELAKLRFESEQPNADLQRALQVVDTQLENLTNELTDTASDQV